MVNWFTEPGLQKYSNYATNKDYHCSNTSRVWQNVQTVIIFSPHFIMHMTKVCIQTMSIHSEEPD